MHVTAYLIELLKQSPLVLALLILARLTKPISIATIVGVFGGKERRKDAKAIVKILCGRKDDDGPPPDG